MPRQDASKQRTTSKTVATKAGCVPLKEMYDRAVSSKPRTWKEIEADFLEAMGGFDTNLANGVADIADLQNGKGDFFNDLLALLLENCAGVTLYSRRGVPGLIFPKHNLDVTLPNTGVVEFLLEAKAVGTPKHPLSPKQKPIGRAGSADLDKHTKEIGFKTTDLKAECARMMVSKGVVPISATGDLTAWLHSVKPRAYVFIAARVINEDDYARVLRFADMASRVNDAVGVFCFTPISVRDPTTYKSLSVPPNLQFERVLRGACQDLLTASLQKTR